MISSPQSRPRYSHKIFLIYLIGFFFSLHVALPAYINSSFLSMYTSPKWVGLLFTISSLFTLFSFAIIPHILGRFGNYKTACLLGIIEVFALLTLAVSTNFFCVTIAFILNFILISIVSLNIDIFLEKSSPVEFVGKIRGFYLTIINTAWVLAALLVSRILEIENLSILYLGSALLMVPALAVLIGGFRYFKDPHYYKISLPRTFITIWKDKNILDTFIISFLLQFFFTWMVIYTPLYLHEYIGFGWSTIGLMFAIMLFPFPILEWPLGKLADRYCGEKEILSIGFMVMAASTALIAFIAEKDFLLWVSILVATRVGAAMVEVGSEIYFFKKVPDTSLSTVSLFRATRPLAYIVSPILATALLAFFDFTFLFIFLGFLMLYGLRFTSSIKDTR